MNWAEAISQLRREVRSMVGAVSSQIIGWTFVSSTTPYGDGDQVQTADGEKGQRPARRIETWGFAGRPPGGVRSLQLRIGSSNVIYIGIARSKAYGPADLEDGESAQYCSVPGTELRADKNGNLKGKVPNGSQINFQNGTNGVARLGDSVQITIPSGTTIAGWGTTSGPDKTFDGVITSASATVKAGD